MPRRWVRTPDANGVAAAGDYASESKLVGALAAHYSPYLADARAEERVLRKVRMRCIHRIHRGRHCGQRVQQRCRRGDPAVRLCLLRFQLLYQAEKGCVHLRVGICVWRGGGMEITRVSMGFERGWRR